MAQFFWDSDDKTVSTDVTTLGWSERWDAFDGFIRDDGLNQNAIKPNDVGENLQRAISWDDPEDGSHDDIEIYALMSHDDRTQFHGIFARGSGAAGSETYYILLDEPGFGNDVIEIEKRVNGSTTSLGSTAFDSPGDTFYCLRFRINGTSLKAKAWIPADETDPTADEPAGWGVETTDSEITGTGWSGLNRVLQGDFNRFWTYDFGVGTNGDAAPTAAVGGGGASGALYPSSLALLGVGMSWLLVLVPLIYMMGIR